jgi:hypothetical protein
MEAENTRRFRIFSESVSSDYVIGLLLRMFDLAMYNYILQTRFGPPL